MSEKKNKRRIFCVPLMPQKEGQKLIDELSNELECNIFLIKIEGTTTITEISND